MSHWIWRTEGSFNALYKKRQSAFWAAPERSELSYALFTSSLSEFDGAMRPVCACRNAPSWQVARSFAAAGEDIYSGTSCCGQERPGCIRLSPGVKRLWIDQVMRKGATNRLRQCYAAAIE